MYIYVTKSILMEGGTGVQFLLFTSPVMLLDLFYFIHKGLPDLVPDVAEFQKSLQYYPYLESRLIYYLTCALEEDCLASSASGKSYNHARC